MEKRRKKLIRALLRRPQPPTPEEPTLEQPIYYNRFLSAIKKQMEREEQEALKESVELGALKEEREEFGPDLPRDIAEYFLEREKGTTDWIKTKTNRAELKRAKQEVRALLDELDRMDAELRGKKQWQLQKGIREAHVRGEDGEWKSVAKRLDKTEFGPFYKYLVNHRYPKWRKDTRELIGQAGGKHWKGDYGANIKDIQDMIVKTFDRQEMGKQLNRSESTIAKYLKWLTKVGVLKRLPNRVGRGGQRVYSMGYWQPYYDKVNHVWGKSRPIYYLQSKDREMIENLFRTKLR